MPRHRLAFGLSILLASFLLQASLCWTGNPILDTQLMTDEEYDDWLLAQGPDTERQPQELQVPAPPEPQGAFLPPQAPAEVPAQPAAPAVEPPPAERPAVAPGPHAPVILSVDYPTVVPADGKPHYGWVAFTDAGGDVNRKTLEVTWGTVPMSGCDCAASPDGSPTAGRVRIGFT